MISFGFQATRLTVELHLGYALCAIRTGLGEVAADPGDRPAHAMSRAWTSDPGFLARATSERPMC